MNFEDLNSNEYDNHFGIDFSSFKGLKETEYEILKSTFTKVDNDKLVFDLIVVDKKIQPLEILVKIISNKTVGDLSINLHDKEGTVLGKILLNKILFTKIDGLIDFAFDVENKNKSIDVLYECGDTTYTGKSVKEEKI